uniref:Biogenesis of lysosome-related organelles complex 1 subunit 5 n=2 Tax=Ornithorhynchus anatinus TaxID=9258 RepID=A0A6I8N6R5_ORNAN
MSSAGPQGETGGPVPSAPQSRSDCVAASFSGLLRLKESPARSDDVPPLQGRLLFLLLRGPAQAQCGGMSGGGGGGGMEAVVEGEAGPSLPGLPAPVGGRRRDSPGAGGSPIHLVIKDLGEIHSRLLDHRPIIQGEARYFVKEFEEKRGLREVRVLEKLKNMICETNELTLPKCKETLHDSLNQVLLRLQAANHSIHRLQQRELEQRKLHNDQIMVIEKQRKTQWEAFVKEQHSKQGEVEEEHKKAMERLKEQYAEMEKELTKFTSF